jgi:hypothetical protein
MKKTDKETKKKFAIHGFIAFLVRFTPYIIGLPILFVVNYMQYKTNNRLLQPATNLMWIGMMSIFWFQHYK